MITENYSIDIDFIGNLLTMEPEIKDELSALKNYHVNIDFKYNKVFISDNDKIIPTKNQEVFWGISSNLHSGHCPFKLFKSWSELL